MLVYRRYLWYKNFNILVKSIGYYKDFVEIPDILDFLRDFVKIPPEVPPAR